MELVEQGSCSVSVSMRIRFCGGEMRPCSWGARSCRMGRSTDDHVWISCSQLHRENQGVNRVLIRTVSFQALTSIRRTVVRAGRFMPGGNITKRLASPNGVSRAETVFWHADQSGPRETYCRFLHMTGRLRLGRLSSRGRTLTLVEEHGGRCRGEGSMSSIRRIVLRQNRMIQRAV